MNSIVFGRDKGERSEDYFYPESMPVRHFYLLSHYIYYGLFFLFSVFWLHVNEFNSFWEELRGRGQKVVTYSDIVSAMLSMMIK